VASDDNRLQFVMKMSDTILISGMGCMTAIGVTAGERAVKQQLSIDVEFPVVGHPAATDSIKDALDYDAVARTVAEVCASREFRLIETAAEQIAERVLEKFPIPQVRILVRKISPIAAPRVDYVSVEIVRPVSL
jgi:7,8-dihydroneopterin aldolase/epimerase/oxygenase